jgi:membrane fusion protein, multidrug efflux system
MPDDATIVALRSEAAEAAAAKREAPQKQPERPAAVLSVPGKPARSSRRPLGRWALFALLPLALIVGCYWYVIGGAVMSTDDPYVEAEKVGISTDISGIVKEVAVTDNQGVAAGQVLYRLDPRQFQIALDDAKCFASCKALSVLRSCPFRNPCCSRSTRRSGKDRRWRCGASR